MSMLHYNILILFLKPNNKIYTPKSKTTQQLVSINKYETQLAGRLV